MKKVMNVLLGLVVASFLVACGGSDGGDKTQNVPDAPAVVQEEIPTVEEADNEIAYLSVDVVGISTDYITVDAYGGDDDGLVSICIYCIDAYKLNNNEANYVVDKLAMNFDSSKDTTFDLRKQFKGLYDDKEYIIRTVLYTVNGLAVTEEKISMNRYVRTNPDPVDPGPVDTTKPVITVKGGTTSMTVGGTYTSPTVTASDDVDGSLTSSVVKSGDTVDPDTVGTYVEKYNVTDSSGNSAIQKTHTVVVSAAPVNQPPVWTQASYDTGLTITDANDDAKVITDLNPKCSDAEGDTITYSIEGVSSSVAPLDEPKIKNSLYIDNGILKIHNLMTNDPDSDATITVTIKAEATGGSNNTNVIFTFDDVQ